MIIVSDYCQVPVDPKWARGAQAQIPAYSVKMLQLVPPVNWNHSDGEACFGLLKVRAYQWGYKGMLH